MQGSQLGTVDRVAAANAESLQRVAVRLLAAPQAGLLLGGAGGTSCRALAAEVCC
jgi:hypothetical protein